MSIVVTITDFNSVIEVNVIIHPRMMYVVPEISGFKDLKISADLLLWVRIPFLEKCKCTTFGHSKGLYVKNTFLKF